MMIRDLTMMAATFGLLLCGFVAGKQVSAPQFQAPIITAENLPQSDAFQKLVAHLNALPVKGVR